MIMREIKFRAQRTDNKEWVCGNLINWNEKLEPRIIWFRIEGDSLLESEQIETNFEVIKESVGQFTGLKNNKGIEIYEGDVILSYGNKYLVDFTPCDGLKLRIIYPEDLEIKGIIQTHENWSYNKVSGCNVLGNIHENPELLCTSQST